MIQYNNQILPSLQQQVLKNTADISNIIEGNIVLAEMGIRVIGQVINTDYLPEASTYNGEYGDAYLVGTEAPYDYYIFTRPFAGQLHPTWFKLGEFPLPGPQGEQGEAGHTPVFTIGSVSSLPAGSAPTVAQSGTSANPILSFGIPVGAKGDPGANGVSVTHQWAGTTLYITSASGTSSANLQGPQGLPAPVITIIAEVPSVDALPQPPSAAYIGKGYIVNTGSAKNLWTVIGDSTYEWYDVGTIGESSAVGTQVYANGSLQEIWDADSKLDKIYDGGPSIYAIDLSSNQVQLPYGAGAQSNYIAQRDNAGNLYTNNPTRTNHVTPKSYVDNAITAIKTEILQTIFPIGSFYMNDTTSTSPEEILGFGRWEQLNATFIMSTGTIGSSGRYVGPGEYGGSYDAIVVEHNHTLNLLADPSGSTYGGLARDLYSSAETYTNSAIVQSTGESGIEANIPRYHSAYIWRRTA